MGKQFNGIQSLMLKIDAIIIVFGADNMLNKSKSILIIMLIAISSKFLGFAREIAMASVFGTTSYTDAYLIATTIPLVIFASLGESLSTTLIPMYSYIVEKKNKNQALKFMNNILNILIMVTFILSILGVLFSKSLVSIFAIGFKGETLELAIKFTKIMLPGIIIIGINYILTAFLQANKNFYVTALVAFPKNIVIIISTILSYFWSKNMLVYGTLLAIASQMLYQLFFAFKNGYTYKIQSKLIDKDTRQLGLLIMPVFLGMTVQQLNVLIDKTLASTLSEGSIAALNFANKLESFVFGVFAVPLVMVVYTVMSQLAAKDDWKAFDDTVRKSISYMLLLLIPISIGAMCLSTPVVKILFQRGSFDARATQMTSTALFYYSLGMIGSGLRIVLSKAFYSLQDTKTPMVNGFYAIIANIVLNLILIKPLGHGGLALATSISSTLGTILLLYSLKAKRSCFEGKKLSILVVKAGMSALFMAIGVTVSYSLLSKALGSGFLRETACLFSCILIGALIYFISIIVMKVEEVSILSLYLKSKFNRMHSKVPYNSVSTGKPVNLLLGVSTLIEDESAVNVYQLISSLPREKYCITLAALEGSIIADKVKSFNENSTSNVKLVVIPTQNGLIPFISNLKIFFILFKIIYNTKFDIVHFHSYKLASSGCIASWLLKVPRILFTVHGWQADGNRKYILYQKIISKISSNIICTSKFDFDKGINNKWIYIRNAHLIYYGIEKKLLREKTLRRQFKISSKTPVIGVIAELNEFYNTAHIIKIFNELKEQRNKFELLLMISSSQKHKCEMYIRELDLSSYVHVLYDSINTLELVSACDIFSYFSDKGNVPIVMIQAMYAEKPIITNNIGAMSELVQSGRNGFIIDEHDIKTAAVNIETLLKSRHVREVMGKNSKSMVYRKFSIEKMVNVHELLYSGFKKS